MKRIATVLILIACSAYLCGCAVDGPSYHANDSSTLTVLMDASGVFHAGDLTVSNADMPKLVEQWHVKHVVIDYIPNAPSWKALELQDLLIKSGITDVTIARH